MDRLFYFCLVLLCFHARLFVDALWLPAVKGLTSNWLSFVMSNWYPGSGVVLDCIGPDLCPLSYFVCLFDLIPNVPVNNLLVISGWIFLG